MKLVVFAATCEIWLNEVPFVDRSIRYAVSTSELSLQLRLIVVAPVAVAVRLDGAAGGGSVVATAMFDHPE